MDYRIIKKSVISKGKKIHRYYYFFYEPGTGKKIQKVCKGCKTQAEANAFISKLPPLYEKEKITIAKIAEFMFVPGSKHMKRLEMLGRNLDAKTIRTKRGVLNLIIEQFGELELKDLTEPKIYDYLGELKRSGSWKNNFLTVVKDVFEEAPFCGVNYIAPPRFPRFRRNTVKKDIFNTAELNTLFAEKLWEQLCENMYKKQPQYNEGYQDIYLLFLCSVLCGLRMGEAIALRKSQFLVDQGMLVVDGFYKYEARIRTNFNKCGSAENQKFRVVPMPDELALVMQKFIKSQDLADDDYVFTRYGFPLRKHLLEKWFARAIELAGIETKGRKLTPHSLRFTYITRMRRNIDGETVQKLAGHNSMEMTEYYTRAAIPEMVEAAKPAVAAANKLFA